MITGFFLFLTILQSILSITGGSSHEIFIWIFFQSTDGKIYLVETKGKSGNTKRLEEAKKSGFDYANKAEMGSLIKKGGKKFGESENLHDYCMKYVESLNPSVDMDCSCGQRMNETNEISGGRQAKAHAFPWMVRLYGGCSGIWLVRLYGGCTGIWLVRYDGQREGSEGYIVD